MKRIVVGIALLALALPLSAFATNSVDFTNSGGTLSGSSAGLSLSGSVLTVVNGYGGMGLITGNNLGSVSFTTGALMSGSLQTGGVFASGGTFTITGNGTGGLPSGAIFSGTFTSPVTWTMTDNANGTHNYILVGSISGTWANGQAAGGATSQLTIAINTGKGMFNGNVRLASGDTSIVSSVPEPGTLGLLGTGMVGLAGVVRRKLKS
ncbi:MAG TPA: PEP-CTERM sorting domain-containing protein [Candidatus Aquilonibacter sp.]|nr:PEP-CTERM sorting domain-containing protein [Candidatus Aquilonibacter sp.]